MNNEKDRETIGEILRKAREYRGFSQEEVATYLQLPRSAISLIETGVRRLDVLELKKLAALYQSSIEQLTGETVYTSEPESVKMVARAAAALSPEDQSEVLRFAEFLQTRKSEKKNDDKA